MSNPSVARVDAFTDAAFAFAVTLLVVGAGGEIDATALARVVASIPAFAIGFAIIAMFWLGHVRWRRYRGDGDWRSLLLTLALVFVTLVYVAPLRAMAASFATFLGASGGQAFAGDLGQLFAVYGSGFAAMALLLALLFGDARRNQALSPQERAAVGGERWIWVILTVTGVASTVLAMIPATARIAPLLYMTSPLTIGLFVWRWDWDGQSIGTA